MLVEVAKPVVNWLFAAWSESGNLRVHGMAALMGLGLPKNEGERQLGRPDAAQAYLVAMSGC
jgi:hypothetical protein